MPEHVVPGINQPRLPVGFGGSVVSVALGSRSGIGGYKLAKLPSLESFVQPPVEREVLLGDAFPAQALGGLARQAAPRDARLRVLKYFLYGAPGYEPTETGLWIEPGSSCVEVLPVSLNRQ